MVSKYKRLKQTKWKPIRDTISHDTLLCKLKSRFGMVGTSLKLLRSYQTDQTFKFIKPNANGFGVPQGSVIGPALFNCLDQSNSLHLKHLFYCWCSTVVSNVMCWNHRRCGSLALQALPLARKSSVHAHHSTTHNSFWFGTVCLLFFWGWSPANCCWAGFRRTLKANNRTLLTTVKQGTNGVIDAYDYALLSLWVSGSSSRSDNRYKNPVATTRGHLRTRSQADNALS